MGSPSNTIALFPDGMALLQEERLRECVMQGSEIALLEALLRYNRSKSPAPSWLAIYAFKKIQELSRLSYAERDEVWKRIAGWQYDCQVFDLLEEVFERAPEVASDVRQMERWGWSKAEKILKRRSDLTKEEKEVLQNQADTYKERASFYKIVGRGRTQQIAFAAKTLSSSIPGKSEEEVVAASRRVGDAGRSHPQYYAPLGKQILSDLGMSHIYRIHRSWFTNPKSRFERKRHVVRSTIGQLLSLKICEERTNPHPTRTVDHLEGKIEKLPDFKRSIAGLLRALNSAASENEVISPEVFGSAYCLIIDLLASDLGRSDHLSPAKKEISRVGHTQRYLRVREYRRLQREAKIGAKNVSSDTDEVVAQRRRLLGTTLLRACELARQDSMEAEWSGTARAFQVSFNLVSANDWLSKIYGDIEDLGGFTSSITFLRLETSLEDVDRLWSI